ncbi:MAG: Ada metal-binding domain-containing protein [Patescibacteria group bacterium]
MDFRSIAEKINEIRRFSQDNSEKIYHIFELCLVAAIFFGAGVLFAQTILYQKPDIKFALDKEITEKNLALLQPENMQDLLKNTVNSATKSTQMQSPLTQTAQIKGEYVASKNGKTYYKTTCSNRIKEENKIYFQSESDAQKSGFTPSKTCFK